MAKAAQKVPLGKNDPDTGIEGREEIAKGLTGALADSYVLLVKTQGYHWNVVGPHFYSVHKLTEEHYQDLFAAVDELAERVRALGEPAPTSTAAMVSASALDEDKGARTAEEMIEALVSDHQATSRRLRSVIETAEEHRDTVTADMLTERIQFHEKAIWMLRSLLA